MNNKKTLITSIMVIFGIVILLVAIILLSFNNREQQTQENMQKIRSNYASFSTNITDNEKIRKDLTEQIDNFDKVPYEDEIGNYKSTLKKYDKNIKYIDTIVKDMESRCQYKYEDLNTQILCKGYSGLYETTVNKYISKVKEYNDKITAYNKKENKTYELHKPVYEDFIDYDKDGKFSGSK